LYVSSIETKTTYKQLISYNINFYLNVFIYIGACENMSVPSLNSLSTAYGSCVGSETDSVLSHQTFKSAKSDSTMFFSGESDTDTLVSYILEAFNYK